MREFIIWSAKSLGIELEFSGSGVQEAAVVSAVTGADAPAVSVGDVIVRVNPRYFRPAEVETLLGDPSHAKLKLGWTPEITAQQMCAEMVQADLVEAKRIKLLRDNGHRATMSSEG